MYQHSCSNCSLGSICLPLGLGKEDLPKLEEIVSTSATKHRGDKIVRQGDAFKSVYAVKSGMCKSFRVDQSGTEHVQSFHLPGEIFGLDAVYSKHYGFTVEALDTSVLCKLQFEDLQQLCTKVTALQQQVFNLFSRELYTSQVNPIEHFDQTAEQKLAGFLYDLLSRLQARGQSSAEIHLPMARRDIANHLCLAPETISRLLKRFQQKGVIAIEGRRVAIKDLDLLRSMVHCHALETAVVGS